MQRYLLFLSLIRTFALRVKVLMRVNLIMEQFCVKAPETANVWCLHPELPFSKSICNRVLVVDALAHLHDGKFDPVWRERLVGRLGVVNPQSPLICDDTRVMLDWLCREDHSMVDVGAAGTAMRFSTALAVMLEGETVLTGSQRMKERPIGVLVDALRKLDAEIEYLEKEGFPPISIKGGGMRGGALHIAGNVSSQYISALLMIAPMLVEGLTLSLDGEIVSRPYINMTLRVMQDAGAQADWIDERTLRIAPVPYRQGWRGFIEKDWSAASYWYEVLALCRRPDAEVKMHFLIDSGLQGDAAVVRIFRELGVETEFCLDDSETVVLRKNDHICSHLSWDFTATPDLAQTVVVTCCMMGIPFHFTGLQSLKIKETDRIAALQTELKKLGFSVDVTDSEMSWDGVVSAPSLDLAIDTYKDHRMAMAFAPCALTLGSIVINDPMVVTKSYSTFWDDLCKAGFTIIKRDV